MVKKQQQQPKYEGSSLFDIPEDETVALDESALSNSIASPETVHGFSCAASASASESSGLFGRLTRIWKGDKGADVAALRGVYGSDFEGYAVVCLGSLKGVGFHGGPKERYLLIKGAFLFVFKEEASPAPKYVIRLANTKTKVVNVSKSMSTVVMKMRRPRDSSEWLMEHKFVFLREKNANDFASTANHEAVRGETDQVQQRLGHAFVLSQNKSLIRYAEKVAIETMDLAPSRGVPLSDIQVGLRLIK